ncbi:RidA family protein [Caballeronia sp. S22]|uniref:RidA family protein n=1 Tax=Caballeronia sp. S22 TaxID=3137182 RepID=UPI0035307477
MNQSDHPGHLFQALSPAELAPPGGHYSHVSIANGLVFVSGQLPIDTHGTKLTDSDFDTQAAQALANLGAALRWACDAKPARAVVPVPALHFGLKIEIEAVATL